MNAGIVKQRVARKSLSLKKTKNKESGKTSSTSDISKYFQKNTSVNGLTEDALIQEPGKQPLAKRRRNDTLVQQCDKNATSRSPKSQKPTECLNNNVNLVAGAKNLQVKLDLSSASFTAIRGTDHELNMSTNSKDGLSHLTNGIEASKMQGCVKIQCPELTNSIISSVGTPNSTECMDLLDDSVIPPTPPVIRFKNKTPITCSVNKSNKSVFFSPYSEDDHIKKCSIANSLHRNLNNSKHVAEKGNVSGNKSRVEPSDKDFTEVGESGEMKSAGNSLRNSSFKLARKTFKLSKKGKKVETAKPPLSTKKLESGVESEVSVAGENFSILSGYGVESNGRSNELIKSNNYENDDNEDFKNNDFKIRTRRKLSLDEGKRNDHHSSHLDDKKPAEVVLDEETTGGTEGDMVDLNHALSEPSGENIQDMFDLSFTQDEVCKLVDGVSWSPMEIRSSSKKRDVIVSPAKQYVRSKSTELNNLTRNIAFQDAKASHGNADLPNQDYQRFLVLEVYRREILDNVTATNAGVEKVLRLFDESDNSEKYCQLREEWERTEIEHGDIVNIIGKTSVSGSYILNNENENYIVVYPDLLVTPTSISTSTKCLRRSVLDKYFKTEGPNQVMFLGTLMHRIFEATLVAKDFSANFILDHATQLLQQPSNLTELYGLGITEDEVLSKVSDFVPFLTEWGTKFFNVEPHPIHSKIDFKDGGVARNIGDNKVAMCVSKVLDIEECVWSPKFGLKGQIDSSVEVKINRNPNIMKKNSSPNETRVLPLELKTGKCHTKLGSVEHRAQVILYSLMMMERYDSTLDSGLLLYLKTGHMLGVPAYKHEKRALVMKRNELIRYLTHTGSRILQSMPDMLQDERNCRYCPQVNVCTIYHKSVENGDDKSAGMGKLFEESTRHLSPLHLKYFSHWNELIALEHQAMQEKANDCDIWCLSGTEREQKGYCFSEMSLVSCSVSEDPARYVNSFRKNETRSSKVNSSDMHLVKGDYIVVSQENGIMALATGFLKEISGESISVLLDKDLTQCYHHKSRFVDGLPLYRIDKAEISTGATIQWSNLAKLFFADNEAQSKLRRLVVDLESPRFSRENDQIPSVSSSNVSEAWSSQLSSCSIASPVKLSQSNNEVNQILQNLNSDQKKAIKKVLTAQDYALILGCPGAGKTHTIACLVRALVSLGKSVLLTSYTHSAVDNILLKLLQNQVDFLRLGSLQKVHSDIQPYVVCNAAKEIKTVKELKDFYGSKLVVATTCLGVNHTLFNQRSFDYCIVDEASQITQPVCIGSLRHSSIFVLVGDHYQLPPLVQSQKARDDGMDISLFKRLSESHPHAVVQLEYQYRMHEDIMLLSNTLIYENRLKCATKKIAETLLELPKFAAFREDIAGLGREKQAQCSWLLAALDPKFPVLFLDTDALPGSGEVRSGHNVYNETEAGLVASVVHGLIKSGLDCDDIGVISPYRQQLKVIKQELNVEHGHYDESSGPQLNVEINTVDKYQGRDKLCVIVSLVRSNAGGHVGDLLRDWRRVNVAVTRAKHKLILLGSRETLNHNTLFQELFALLEMKAWIRTLPSSAWRGLLPW